MSKCQCKTKQPKFDEPAFLRQLRKLAEPDLTTVETFATAAECDPALRLRVLSKVRGAAADTPAALLTIYALGLTAFTFIINLLANLAKIKTFDADAEAFWRNESIVVAGLVVAGVVVFLVGARKQKCATMWKLAFEDALD